MAQYTPPGGKPKKVTSHKSTATMKSVGTKAEQARARRTVAAAAIMLVPGAKVASAVGKVATRAAAKKYAPTAAKKVSKTVTQGRTNRVIVEPPKSTGAGKSSPVKGTKVTTQSVKRGQTSKQQASQNEGRSTRIATSRAVDMLKAGAGTAYARDERNRSASKKGKK